MKQIPQYKLDDKNIAPSIGPRGTSRLFGNNIPGSVFPHRQFSNVFQRWTADAPDGPVPVRFLSGGAGIAWAAANCKLGLEHFSQTPGTVNCSFPNQLFSKTAISKDIFGYYVLFNPGFLEEVIPDARIADEFPFFITPVTPFHFGWKRHCHQTGRRAICSASMRNCTVSGYRPGKSSPAISLPGAAGNSSKSYGETLKPRALPGSDPEGGGIRCSLTKFLKLVQEHYLSLQRVADYAGMFYVTPNHLNRKGE